MSTPAWRRRLEVVDCGDYVIVSFIDKKLLDEQIITKIGEELFNLVDKIDPKRILLNLNFGNVDYISAAFFGKLMLLNQKVKKNNGKLVMCSMSQGIYEVFEITNLHRMFNIVKDEEAALVELAKL